MSAPALATTVAAVPVLGAQGLRITGPAGPIVHGIDLLVRAGRTLALVGESGSGKSLTAKALTGLLPPGLSATGTAQLAGAPLDLGGGERTWRGLRGSAVVLLLQDPFTSLSPLHRCGAQVGAALPGPVRRDRRRRRAEVLARLDEVGLPERVARAYPFELSGGMRQRVAIAAALASGPQVLIADEPTTALDVTTQAGILDLLETLQLRHRMGLLLITHDLRLARERAHDVVVLRHGSVVEAGPVADVLDAPAQPYTVALAAAVPPLHVRVHRLPTLDDADADGAGDRPAAVTEPGPRALPAGGAPLLRVTDLAKTFHRAGVTALDRVSLEVHRGECLGVVGESGSGKTTLARCVVGLEHADAGQVVFDTGPGEPEVRSARPAPDVVQIVFQDPYSALNPALTVRQTLVEALAAAGRGPEEVPSLLDQVRLPAGYGARHPRALSGGERQRVAIARALAPRPRLLVCDESVSALDVSVQAQILNLLQDVRDELGLSLLFISHDLAVVRQVADRITVMLAGRVVESGAADDVLTRPQHEYTRRLIASVPGTTPREASA